MQTTLTDTHLQDMVQHGMQTADPPRAVNPYDSLPSTTPMSNRLASLARESLIAEAELTPKPGLVDRRGSGAHHDLSLALMRPSATAIEPYFGAMASCSQGQIIDC